MKRAGYVAFVAGVVLLALLMLRANWGVLLHALTSFGVGGLLVLVILHLPVIAAAGVAWWIFGRRLPGATLSAFVRARIVRDSVAAALPFSQIGGFAAGVRVLALSGVPTLYCALSMFADLLAEFASLIPYVAIGLVALAVLAPRSGLFGPLAIGTSVVAAAMTVAWVGRGRAARWLRAPIGKIVSRFAGGWPDAFPDSPGTFDKIDLSRRALAANMGLHFGRWAIGAVETWVAFRLMGVPITLGDALIIDCISAALRVFAFMVPAAIGVQEGVYVLVCGIVGLPPAIALAYSFVWRARDVLIGFLGLAVWHVAETTESKGKSAAPDTTASHPQRI